MPTDSCDLPATCSEMVERVARMIWLVDTSIPRRNRYRQSARAAIEAMRLTHQGGLELGKVGAHTIFSDYKGDQTCAQVVIDGWNAMIDAALA